MTPLDPKQVTAALLTLPEWQGLEQAHTNALQRSYRFVDFMKALDFMNDAAPEIQRLNHHPEWTNVYDQVRVRLTTHDAGDRITAADVELAKILDWVALRFA